MSNEKKIERIELIFDTKNWLWKPKSCKFHGQISNRALICQRPFPAVRKCYLPFNSVWCGSCRKFIKLYLLLTLTIRHYVDSRALQIYWPPKGQLFWEYLFSSAFSIKYCQKYNFSWYECDNDFPCTYLQWGCYYPLALWLSKITLLFLYSLHVSNFLCFYEYFFNLVTI